MFKSSYLYIYLYIVIKCVLKVPSKLDQRSDELTFTIMFIYDVMQSHLYVLMCYLKPYNFLFYFIFDGELYSFLLVIILGIVCIL